MTEKPDHFRIRVSEIYSVGRFLTAFSPVEHEPGCFKLLLFDCEVFLGGKRERRVVELDFVSLGGSDSC